MRCWVIDTQKKGDWKELMERFPQCRRDIYFTPEYTELSRLNGDGDIRCFCFEEGNHVGIYPFIINEIKGYEFGRSYFDIETPYGYGGPVLSSDDAAVAERFEESFLNFCAESSIVAEFIRFHPLIKNNGIFKNAINVQHNRFTVQLPLDTDIQAIWNNEICSKNRNMIRKAQSAGIEVRPLGTDQFDIFVKIYLNTMKKLGAEDYYFFNEDYFNGLKSIISERGIILGAYLDGRVIACSAFFYYENYFHYHLSGSDEKYLKLAPNNLLLYKAIEAGLEKGCTIFHFGGGRTEAPDDSLLKFKKSFSRHTGDFYTGKRILNKEIYSSLINEWERKNNEKAKLFLQYKVREDT